MPTLQELQKQAKPLVDTIGKKLDKYAPEKTGNLKAALKRANTFNTIFETPKGFSKTKPSGGLTFSIDYSPQGAEYGKFWNDPTISSTVKKAKTKNKNKTNFAQKTIDDPQVQKELNKLLDGIASTIANQISEQIDDILK